MRGGTNRMPALFLGSVLLILGFTPTGLSSSPDNPGMLNSPMEQAPRPVTRLLKKGMTQTQFEQTIHPSHFFLNSFKPFTLFVEYRSNLFPGQTLEVFYRSDGKEYRVKEWFVRPREAGDRKLWPYTSP